MLTGSRSSESRASALKALCRGRLEPRALEAPTVRAGGDRQCNCAMLSTQVALEWAGVKIRSKKKAPNAAPSIALSYYENSLTKPPIDSLASPKSIRALSL